jgi:methyl-accepting chemotaxis protein
MASTSEELSSQAQQLQQTMSFFQVDGGSSGGALRPRKPKALPPGPSAHMHSSKPAPRPSAPRASTKGGGIDLDLSSDHGDDGDFEKF